MRPRHLCAVLAACAVLLGTTAYAAPDAAALAKARSQFQRALALQTAGDWGGALSLLQDVASVATTPQVRFNIALCEEQLGKLSAALGDYQIAAAEASAAGANDVRSEAGASMERVRTRLPTVIIKRGRGADVGRIALDGTELGEAAIAKETPLDPGPHQVELRPPGGPPHATSFSLAEGDRKTVEVVAAEPPPPLDRASPRQPVDVGATHRSLALPLVIGGLGVAGLASAGIFALLEAGAVSDLDNVCGPSRNACPASSQSTYDHAKTFETVARISLAVGVVAVGTAIVWLVTSPSSARGRTVPRAAKAPRFDFVLETPSTPTGRVPVAGANLTGRF